MGAHMRRMSMMMTAAGLGLAVCLYGCGGSKPADTSEQASTETAEQSVDSSGTEETTQKEEKKTPAKASKTELEVSGCDYSYALKKVGSFKGSERDLSFTSDAAIGRNDGGQAVLVGIDGKPMLDGKAIQGVKYWCNGTYLFAEESGEANNVGLVSLADGVIIPAESATIVNGTERPEDARFLEVVYATDKTDNKDECFVYTSQSLISLGVQEGDTMYKGYAKVFDLEKRAFVEGVQIDNGEQNAFKDLGDAFVVKGKDGTYTMYDASGKELWSTKDNVRFGAHSVYVDSNGKESIVDTTGATTFEYDGYDLSTCESTDDIYTLKSDDGVQAVDMNGDAVLDGTFERIVSESYGLFTVTEGGKTKIIDKTGKVYAEDIDEYSTGLLIPGILRYKDGAGKYGLCMSDGRLIEDIENASSDLVIKKGDKYVVLKTGKADLALKSPATLDKALAKVRMEDGQTYKLYDLFTGKELIDGGAESIGWAGGYVYAFKDGTWTVYEAKLSGK